MHLGPEMGKIDRTRNQKGKAGGAARTAGRKTVTPARAVKKARMPTLGASTSKAAGPASTKLSGKPNGAKAATVASAKSAKPATGKKTAVARPLRSPDVRKTGPVTKSRPQAIADTKARPDVSTPQKSMSQKKASSVVATAGRGQSKPVQRTETAETMTQSEQPPNGTHRSAKMPTPAKRPRGKPSSIVLPPDYRPGDNEPFMSEMHQQYFRTKLLSWKDDIIKQNRETLQVLHEDSAQHADIADRATSEADRALELRARDRQRKLISKIDAAISRIDDGSYGYCEETGEPISLKRLDARPIATLSLEAQERHERRERVYRDDN
jgi:DnaK suppressor protein